MNQIKPKSRSGWKAQAWAIGSVAGALFGLVAAYFYSRAAEDDAIRNGNQPNRVSTGEVLGLLVAGVAMIRQITEMGKAPTKKR
jgi:hypothetical protein